MTWTHPDVGTARGARGVAVGTRVVGAVADAVAGVLAGVGADAVAGAYEQHFGADCAQSADVLTARALVESLGFSENSQLAWICVHI